MTIFISTRVLILLIYLSKNGAAVRFCSMRKHKSAFLSFENCINKFKSKKKTAKFSSLNIRLPGIGLERPRFTWEASKPHRQIRPEQHQSGQ